MRLYVEDISGKIYLRNIASSREELSLIIGISFIIRDKSYSIEDVKAERGSSNTITGAVIGAVMGIICGLDCLLLGIVVGGIIGELSDNEEDKRVFYFNRC